MKNWFKLRVECKSLSFMYKVGLITQKIITTKVLRRKKANANKAINFRRKKAAKYATDCGIAITLK